MSSSTSPTGILESASYSDYIMDTMGAKYMCFIPSSGFYDSSKKRVLESEDEVSNGKGRAKKVKKVKKVCCICEGDGTPGVVCSDGHASCKSCLRQYVNLTLLPTKTVYYDFIPCPAQCDKFLPWKKSTKSDIVVKGVENILLCKTKKVMEKRQMDVSYLICGERDPSSEKEIGKHCKLCPNCRVPIEKNSGCDHVKCRCGHNFWWTCGGTGGTCNEYPFHADDCSRGYVNAPVAGQ